MTRLVHTSKAEVTVLTDFTTFNAVDHHGFVSCSLEFLAVDVVDFETDGLTTKPITCSPLANEYPT